MFGAPNNWRLDACGKLTKEWETAAPTDCDNVVSDWRTKAGDKIRVELQQPIQNAS